MRQQTAYSVSGEIEIVVRESSEFTSLEESWFAEGEAMADFVTDAEDLFADLPSS